MHSHLRLPGVVIDVVSNLGLHAGQNDPNVKITVGASVFAATRELRASLPPLVAAGTLLSLRHRMWLCPRPVVRATVGPSTTGGSLRPGPSE